MSERDSASFVFGSPALLTPCLKLQTKVKDYTSQQWHSDGLLQARKIPEVSCTHIQLNPINMLRFIILYVIYNIKSKQTKPLFTSQKWVQKWSFLKTNLYSMFLPLDRVEISIASVVISVFPSSSAALRQKRASSKVLPVKRNLQLKISHI